MATYGLRGMWLWTLATCAGIAGLSLVDHRLVIACAGASVAFALHARSSVARRRRAARLERARRRKQREERELRLEEAGVTPYALDELTDIVDTVTHDAPDDARRYELDELLDLYTELLVAGDTYERQLVRAPLAIPDSTPALRAVRERARAWRDQCAHRAVVCNELLIDVSELIRLYAERAMTPEIDQLFSDDIVGRQLGCLDASA